MSSSPVSDTTNSQNQVKSPAMSIKKFLPLIILGAALVAAWLFGLFDLLSLDALKQHHEWLTQQVQNNYLVVALVFILAYVAVAALSIPGSLWLSLTGGLLFGPWFGTFFTVLGATIGATLLFLAAKTAFGSTLRDKAGPFVNKLAAGFNKDAFSYLLTLRLVPLFPFWLVNLAPSLVGVKLRTFFIATFFGIIPGSFVYNLVGSSIGLVLQQGGEPDLSLLTSPTVIAAFVGLGVLSLIPVVYKRIAKNPDA